MLVCFAQGFLPEVKVRPGRSLHNTGGAALLLLLGQSGVVHLPYNLSEQLIHHALTLGRGLYEGTAPLLCKGTAIRTRDLPLWLQVYLIPHQDQRHLLKALHTNDLVPHWSDVLQGMEIRVRSSNVEDNTQFKRNEHCEETEVATNLFFCIVMYCIECNRSLKRKNVGAGTWFCP